MLLAVLAMSTVFFVRDERHEMEQILKEKGETAVNITSARIARSISPEDPQGIAAELAPVLEDRDFDYAYVFDHTHILASASDPEIQAPVHEPVPDLDSLRPGHSVVRTTDNYMEVIAPIMQDGQRIAGLGLEVSLELLARQGKRIRLRLFLVTAGLVTTALACIYWWTRKTVQPLRDLTRSAQRLSEGDLSVRVPVTRADEVGTLAATFNHLATSLERTLQEKDRVLSETNRLYRNLKVARARLNHAERLSALGMLAAGVSHELNNPLGIILSTAGNLREALGETNPLAEDVAIIESETQRCRRIIQGLLNFAASSESNPVEVDINSLLRETFALAVRGERAIKVDVRVIAATNADLAERIRSGDFRPDLFYRLNVVSVRIPPLRERVDDILPLAHHFLRKHDGSQRITGVDTVAAQILRRYQWPGNVRELENAVERATLLAKGEEITPSDLPPELNAGSEVERPALIGKSLSAAREDFERYFILECLRRHHGNVSRAAREAGLHRQNFYQKLHKYGIQRRDYMM